ncbi:hypothetical protein [Mycobacterium sp. 94-17]|uniref:hypothetical protein n=1 Tax=Mycobacterium sp. 94-17 TaxID=2986147 RepID=UPI002D1F36A6|nr:hypothetical protein [Mycobacterium sp. 94-17]MEB4208740.1 hypothetical protein [Mycobacterium sp. 94-17]
MGNDQENTDFIRQPGATPWPPADAGAPLDYPLPGPLSTAPFYLPNLIAAIVAGVGIVVGSIGTWASLGPLSLGGMDFRGDWGLVTLILGAIAAVALFVQINWGRTSFSLRWAVPIAWAVLVAGVGCLAIALVNIATVTSFSKVVFGVPGVAQVGWGLWLVVICSAVLTVTAAIVAVQVGTAASHDYRHPSQAAWSGAWRWAAIVASAIIFVIAIINAYRPFMIDNGGSQQVTATATQTVTERPSTSTVTYPQPRLESPAPVSAAETLPPNATHCSSNAVNIPLSNSAAGTEITSCPFAEAVRAQYLRQDPRGAPITLNVMSPVTSQSYVMTCIGSHVVTCTGANDAVVYLY